MIGWIKLHRSILDWEWYEDVNARLLLLHLLVSVNYEKKKWRGIEIEPGSMVLSWSNLSESCGISIQKCRTAMSKLESSGEITRKTTNKYQVVSLVKWDKLQVTETGINNRFNNQTTTSQQSTNNQLTTTKEDKEYKEYKEHENDVAPGLGRKEEVKNDSLKGEKEIPELEEFMKYALDNEPNASPEHLKLKYKAWKESGWKTGGDKPRKIKNWKTTLLHTLVYLPKIPALDSKPKKESAHEILMRRYNIENI